MLILTLSVFFYPAVFLLVLYGLFFPRAGLATSQKQDRVKYEVQLEKIEHLRRKLGDNDLSYLKEKVLLADKCFEQYDMKRQALKLLVEVIAALETIVGKTHVLYVTTVHKLGIFYFISGDKQKAFELILGIVKTCENYEELNIDVNVYLSFLETLCNLYKSEGKVAKVKEYTEKILKILYATLDPDSDHLLSYKLEYLNYLVTAGDYEGASEIGNLLVQEFERSTPNMEDQRIKDFKKVLEKFNRKAGASANPNKTESGSKLIEELAASERLRRETILEQDREFIEKLKTSTEPLSDSDVSKYITVKHKEIGPYLSSGDYQMVISLAEGILEFLRTINCPEDHPYVVEYKMGLSLMYSEKGYSEKAIELGKFVLEKRTALYGADDEKTIECMTNLCLIYTKNGDPVNALDIGRKSLDLCLAKLGPKHNLTRFIFEHVYLLTSHTENAEELEKLNELKKVFEVEEEEKA
jgi:tetratricopeptide (TPR) repeat protein